MESNNIKDDENAIRTLVDTWMSATKKGDIQIVLELMTDDVIFQVPGQKPFGKKEFEETSKKMMDIKIEGKSDIQEIKILGDWAYLRNYLEMEMKSPNKKPIRHSGYTLTILKKENGKWKLTRDANLLTYHNEDKMKGGKNKNVS